MRRVTQIFGYGMLIVAVLFVVMILLVLTASHRANSIRLPDSLKNPPLSMKGLFSENLEVTARPHPSTHKLEEIAKVKNYTDYLRLRLSQESGTEVISRYLHLRKRYDDENIEKSFAQFRYFRADDDKFGIFHDARIRLGAWFNTHASFVEEVHQFCQSGPLPLPTVEEQCEYRKHNLGMLSLNDDPFLRVTLDLLVSCARWHASEKRYAEGRRLIQDSFRFIETCQLPKDFSGCRTQILLPMIASSPIHTWIGNPDFPVAELQPLIPLLEHVEASFLSPEVMRQSLIESYLLRRIEIVSAMEAGSWRDPVFNWNLNSTNPTIKDVILRDYYLKVNLSGGKTLRILRADLAASDAIQAIRNRMNTVDALKKFDALYTEEIARARLPYRQIKDEVSKRNKKDKDTRSFLTAEGYRMMLKEEIFDNTFRATARFHLLRLGASWRLDPKAALARRDTKEFQNIPLNPWRDPFTDKPFLFDAASSATLFYSVGPNLKDQHGKEDDIAIKVPSLAIPERGDLR